MSSPLTLWYVARTQQEQDIRRAAAWRRAHQPKAAAPGADGGRATRRPVFRRLASLVVAKPGTGGA